MPSVYCSIPEAIEEIKKAHLLIIVDSLDRENEGDIFFPAQQVTAEKINFMYQHTVGLICVPITAQRATQLNLPLMVEKNEEHFHVNFTISVDARYGITTGAPASDKVKTIQILAKPNSQEQELVKPGHIFPLIAREGGLAERQGHTEAAVELAQLAGYDPSGVICELIDEVGEMLRGKKLEEFAQAHSLKIISIEQLTEYTRSTA